MKELTEKQRDFAERNHGLVYSFLHSRNLPEDEFYDVAVFGFLRAVQRYTEEPKLKRYAFSTIAFRAMQSEVGHYRKSKKAQKRFAEVWSLDYALNNNGSLTFGDVLEDRNSDVCDLICTRDALQRMEKPFDNMADMRLYGYSNTEIAERYQVKTEDIEDCFDKLYAEYCLAA